VRSLNCLENESLSIISDTLKHANNPVVLYSMGKDSFFIDLISNSFPKVGIKVAITIIKKLVLSKHFIKFFTNSQRLFYNFVSRES